MARHPRKFTELRQGKREDRTLIRGLLEMTLAGEINFVGNATKTIYAAIKEIDKKLSDQVAVIRQHPEFQKLERTWQRLNYLVMNCETSASLKLKVLNVSKHELMVDFDEARGFEQSHIFNKMCDEEYGTAGGEPYGLIIGDYEFTNRAIDVFVLKEMSKVAAAAFAPFISAASPQFFGFDDWQALSKLHGVEKRFAGMEYTLWRAFRSREDSRLVTLVIPRVLARIPYGNNTQRIEDFAHEEGVERIDPEMECWISASWAYAVLVARAFTEWGWLARTRGDEEWDHVEARLSRRGRARHGDAAALGQPEVVISEKLGSELSNLGFMPLMSRGKTLAFFSSGSPSHESAPGPTRDVPETVQGSRRPGPTDSGQAPELGHLLCGARFIHVINAMIRDKLDRTQNILDCEARLSDWIGSYLFRGYEFENDWLVARTPLAYGRIEIVAAAAPGQYDLIACLAPQFQFESPARLVRFRARLTRLGRANPPKGIVATPDLGKVDAYLLHALHEASWAGSLRDDGKNLEGAALVPMVVRVRDPGWGSGPVPHFAETSRLGRIVAGWGSAASLEALNADPNVLCVEGSRAGGVQECQTSLPFVRADLIHRNPPCEKGDHSIVGIIDGGIDVFHEAFLDAEGRTRFLAVWDQTSTAGPSPAAGYGTLHTEAKINEYIRTRSAQWGLQRDLSGHGTHVASIAAGRAVGRFAGGMAPEAKIVAVIAKLGKHNHGDPLSIGYSNSHIDALSFIQDVAVRNGLPVVVNVSLGMNAGAHDGTSALEAAFDEFSRGGRRPGYIIVKSAGNERGRDGHAKISLGSYAVAGFTWRSSAIARSEDIVEVWFPSCDDVRFRLVNPYRDGSPWVGQSNPVARGRFPNGDSYLLAFTRFHVDNGDSRLLVTIAPSTPLRDIAAGIWTLQIETAEVRSSGRIDAWVERIDSRPIAFISHQDEEMTLSIPATARTVIAVGAVQTSRPFRLFVASSFGPTRDGREKPDVSAPGEAITAARSGSDGEVVGQSGTSMAAPHVTGAIALLLSRREKERELDPDWKQWSAAQIQAALTQNTQNFNGVWTPGIGFGVLDVQRLLEALKTDHQTAAPLTHEHPGNAQDRNTESARTGTAAPAEFVTPSEDRRAQIEPASPNDADLKKPHPPDQRASFTLVSLPSSPQ
jgi:endonuclease G